MKETGFIKQLVGSLRMSFPENFVYHWKNNNATQTGLPDLEIITGNTYYIECKYVKKPPKRPDSKMLSHPFTPTQYKNAYLITKAGGYCVGLIGIGNMAFIIPPNEIKCRNFTLNELTTNEFKVIKKFNGNWPIDELIKIMRNISMMHQIAWKRRTK